MLKICWQKDEISINDAANEMQNLKNINKSKEYSLLRSTISDKKTAQDNKNKLAKVESYKNLLDAFANSNYENNNLPNSIVSKISKLQISKSNSVNLQYACIKLEIMAGIDSLKKDKDVRQAIQLEMLTSKFNKSSGGMNNLDDLIIYFFENLSNKEITAAEKTLWKRVSQSAEAILS